ncbi:MAG: toprim domain-containing protein [Alphaproteobacteria bacterium]|nr:toprim domain-containing protein [Alphaproteobacteria bacterium]
MIETRALIAGLGGKWHGRYGMARCPAHDDREPSFSVRHMHDGPALHCFAGCSFKDVVHELKRRGLWHDAYRADPARRHAKPPPDAVPDPAIDDARRSAKARALWDGALPMAGTRVETYLAARGIALPPIGIAALRFLPRHLHTNSGRTFPCLIASLTDAAERVVAVHRIYLNDDGTAKAPVQPAKKSLGPMAAAAVKLVEPKADVLGLAEGIETALSGYLLHYIPVWATAGTGRLAKVAIPPFISRLVLFADEGKEGRDAADAAATAHRRRGYTVDVIPPSAEFGDTVEDFNDVLQQRAAR